MEAPVGAAPFVVPVSELEDWQLVLPDGRIRGGFTTRAQIEIAMTSGAAIPSHISELEASLSMCSFRGQQRIGQGAMCFRTAFVALRVFAALPAME
jgi:hypothetical protein